MTRLRWESEGKELDANQQLALVVAERDALKAKLQQQQDDSVQVRRESANSNVSACSRVVLTSFICAVAASARTRKGRETAARLARE